ncbi:CPBP family intramembrane metalloprotease [Streptococcus cristatus]|uniref:CPBP family intramembrane metalloprotease n=1 Tax=Streptococcus cristatus TaxID=45634 RepID=A0A5B0DAE0_STRCR|nr:type II CAAX endopeptidase family protein [Streptococcus cristatus]KAA0963773.1 CPBP family intramembrane metalloprotease [Streptococcus cristatus]
MSLSFLSKSNPLISNVKKGKFLTPWFLSPFILYYITQYISPIRKASTDFFIDKQSWIPDWWNILDLLSFLYTIIAFFLWVRFIEKRPIRTMGFSKGNGLSEFAKGVLVGAIMITTVLVVFFITGDAKFDRIQFSLPFLVSWVLVLIGYILQTAAEEIYIRGWLVPIISYHKNAYLAILIASTMFSYFHLDNNGASWLSTLHLFIFGLFTAVYAMKRGNIWGPCGFHFAWNFIMGNVYGFHVSGYDSESSLMYFTTSNRTFITGGQFGPEGGIPGLVVFILALLWAIFILKDTSKEQESLYPQAIE